jgi:hypothetical protein
LDWGEEAKIAVWRFSEWDGEEGCRVGAPEAAHRTRLGLDDDVLAG